MKPIWMLPSLSLANKSQLPPLPGIYYVCSGTKVLYIGKAVSLQLRWNSSKYGDHHKLEELKRYPSPRIYWVEVHGERLRSHIEALEIRKYRPLLNRRKESPDFWWGLWDRLTDLLAISAVCYFVWRIVLENLFFAMSLVADGYYLVFVPGRDGWSFRWMLNPLHNPISSPWAKAYLQRELKLVFGEPYAQL